MTESPSTARLRRLRGLTWALLDVCAAGLAVFVGLYLLTGTRLWPIALAADGAHWLLLPSLIIVPLALRARRWGTLLLSGISVLALVGWFGPRFLPHGELAQADRPVLRVMAFNVNDGGAAPDLLVPVLANSGADLIALEELNAAQAEAIERELSEAYRYHWLEPLGIPGKGLLSHYPILTAELLPDRSGGHSRDAHLTLDVAGRTLTVIVAHPPPPVVDTAGYRANPYAADSIGASAALAAANGPAILLGDFNTTELSANYAVPTAAGLTDAFQTAGWGFGATWPARIKTLRVPFPLVRIDYIWHTADFTAQAAWVGPYDGSDHYPILAELVWQDGEIE
jgi:vancomycin resistance protein VanJ